jgi:hypothetical protein
LPPPDLPSSTRPRGLRRVLSARSLRKRAFIVPLRPTCRCVTWVSRFKPAIAKFRGDLEQFA